VQTSIGHWRFIQSTRTTGSFLACYGTMVCGNHGARHRETTEIEKIRALCVGSHLAPAKQPYLDDIMNEPKRSDIDHLTLMLCSGSHFLEMARKPMPAKPILRTTGSTATFAA
jgi:hypothetical protein